MSIERYFETKLLQTHVKILDVDSRPYVYNTLRSASPSGARQKYLYREMILYKQLHMAQKRKYRALALTA